MCVCVTAQQLNGAPLDPSAGSALTSHADKLKWKLLTQFSTFFSNFINNRIFSHCIPTVNHTFLSSSVPSRHQVHVSGSVERCFVTGCQLLCVLAQLPVSRDSNGDDKGTCTYIYMYTYTMRIVFSYIHVCVHVYVYYTSCVTLIGMEVPLL